MVGPRLDAHPDQILQVDWLPEHLADGYWPVVGGWAFQSDWSEEVELVGPLYLLAAEEEAVDETGPFLGAGLAPMTVAQLLAAAESVSLPLSSGVSPPSDVSQQQVPFAPSGQDASALLLRSVPLVRPLQRPRVLRPLAQQFLLLRQLS